MDADRTVERAKEKEERMKVVNALLRAGTKKSEGQKIDFDLFWNGPKKPQMPAAGFVRG
jgi:hypothetical protein